MDQSSTAREKQTLRDIRDAAGETAEVIPRPTGISDADWKVMQKEIDTVFTLPISEVAKIAGDTRHSFHKTFAFIQNNSHLTPSQSAAFAAARKTNKSIDPSGHTGTLFDRDA